MYPPKVNKSYSYFYFPTLLHIMNSTFRFVTGYIKHEAVQWKDNSWYFLPRKLSNEPFETKADYCKATNVFVKSDDAFENLSVVYVGGRNSNYDKCRAYSAFKFLPAPNDNMVVGLKTVEMVDDKGDQILKTYTIVFDAVSGNILLNDTLVSDSIKFEGMEIAPT